MWSYLAAFESGDFSTWLREGNFIGEPFATFYVLLGIHSIGMAAVVGISMMLASRIFGFQLSMSMQKANQLMGLAWWGFYINLISGVFIFLAQPRREIITVLFWSKMLMIVLAVFSMRFLQKSLATVEMVSGPNGNGDTIEIAPWNVRVTALLLILFWLFAIVSGRLIGYTQPPPPL